MGDCNTFSDTIITPPRLDYYMAELNLTNLINLKSRGLAQLNYAQAMQEYMGPNVSPIKWYTSTGQPNVPPEVTATATELSNFASWYYESFIIETPSGNKREYFLDKFPIALTGLYLAKASNLGRTFGIGVEGDFHAQQIRPETVLDLTGSPTANITSWARSVTQGWNTGFFVFNTSSTATTLSQLQNTLNRVNFTVWGFLDQSYPSKVQAYRVIGPGGKPYGVEAVNIMNVNGQESLINMPAAFYVANNETWSIDMEFNASGSEYIVPQGIQFVTTDYYNIE